MTLQPMQGGTQANYTGTVLEKFIADRLTERGYALLHAKKFEQGRYLEQPIYARRFNIGPNLYGSPLFCDFILYHVDKWPTGLIIESKWQQSTGSVDEKFPFLVENIKQRYPSQTIVLLDGNGYRKGAEKWLREQSGSGNLIHVFTMSEFQKWVNQGHL